jgi:hypothetical protein
LDFEQHSQVSGWAQDDQPAHLYGRRPELPAWIKNAGNPYKKPRILSWGPFRFEVAVEARADFLLLPVSRISSRSLADGPPYDIQRRDDQLIDNNKSNLL